jgi:acyl carrier protein
VSEAGTTREDTGQTLAGFWQELLYLDSVNPDSRLLELGGNSLVAVMLANRIELTWGIRPSMEELLTLTFQELSAWCDSNLSG